LRYERLYPLPSDPLRENVKIVIDQPTSRFGVDWEDISTAEDRKYWIAGSHLRVVDLTDNTVVAERIGYFIESGFGSRMNGRRPWLTSRGPNTTCPSAHDWSDRWFVLTALRPGGDAHDGK